MEHDVNNHPAEMDETIQNKLILQSIEQRLFNIERCYFNPQILVIEGYNQLRSTPFNFWKSRLYTLFCDTYLSHYWILDIWQNSSHDDPYKVPNTVFIKLVTYTVKIFVKKTLTQFFSSQNVDIKVYA